MIKDEEKEFKNLYPVHGSLSQFFQNVKWICNWCLKMMNWLMEAGTGIKNQINHTRMNFVKLIT